MYPLMLYFNTQGVCPKDKVVEACQVYLAKIQLFGYNLEIEHLSPATRKKSKQMWVSVKFYPCSGITVT